MFLFKIRIPDNKLTGAEFTCPGLCNAGTIAVCFQTMVTGVCLYKIHSLKVIKLLFQFIIEIT